MRSLLLNVINFYLVMFSSCAVLYRTNVRKMTKCSCCSSHSSSSNWSPSGKLIHVSKPAAASASALLVVTTPSTLQSLLMMSPQQQQQHSSISSAASGASHLDSNSSFIHSLIGAITGLICSYFVLFSFHPQFPIDWIH